MRTFPPFRRMVRGTAFVFLAFGGLFGFAWLASTGASRPWPGAILALTSWVWLLGRAIRVMAPRADELWRVDPRLDLRRAMRTWQHEKQAHGPWPAGFPIGPVPEGDALRLGRRP